jgi:hypothetical protein
MNFCQLMKFMNVKLFHSTLKVCSWKFYEALQRVYCDC